MSVRFHTDIGEGSKVVIAISDRTFLTGEKLKELIESLKAKNCDVTVLIADSLQKHNGDEQGALQRGQTYLEQNAEILKDINVVRWSAYIASKGSDFNEKQKLIEERSKEGATFYNKMARTHKKCAISNDLENSLKYQKEEYAVILTMSEFNHLIYPKNITDGMLALYQEFSEIKMPIYTQVSFPSFQAKYAENLGVFKTENKRHENSLPLALRLLYDQTETLLRSPEISSEAKKMFKEQLRELFAKYDEKVASKKHLKVENH